MYLPYEEGGDAVDNGGAGFLPDGGCEFKSARRRAWVSTEMPSTLPKQTRVRMIAILGPTPGSAT